MDFMNIKTAVISNSRLVELAGSEISTMEIAEVLTELGVSVTIAAFEISESYRLELARRGYYYIDLSEPTELKPTYFDLAWLHHTTTYYSLFSLSIQAGRVIFSSLSYFEPIESPPLEVFPVDAFLVNSEEGLEKFEQLYEEYARRCRVFSNAAPAEYWDAFVENNDKTLRSVAVISNHVAPEVSHLGEILAAEGVAVSFYGIESRPRKITADVLKEYDAVITIGKTVQYCLAAGIPVFCYDRFAGPGWITLENFEAARKANFSGRSHPSKRPAGLLYTEFLKGFDNAIAQRCQLRDIGKQYFVLRENLITLLTELERTDRNQRPWPTLSATTLNLIRRHNDIILRNRSISANAEFRANIADQKVAQLRSRSDQLVAENESLFAEKKTLQDRLIQVQDQLQQSQDRLKGEHQRIEAIYRSTSWQLTYPIRMAKTGITSSIEAVRIKAAWVMFLFSKGISVARHEGIRPFFRKSTGYLSSVIRNRAARVKRRGGSFDFERDARAPLVSFVIPIYDRTDVLREAIQSALGQTMPNVEVILITDGSPQATLNVVSEFSADRRVRIFHFPVSSGNAVRGRNKGILEARGKYIAFLDSDDVAKPDRLEKSLPLLESGAADVVYGGWQAKLDGSRLIDGIKDRQIVFSPDADLALLKKHCVPCQSTVLVRRELLIKAGFLKPQMEYREDHELWARIAYFGGVFRSITQVLVDLRLHSGNNELNFKGNDERWLAMLEGEYERQGPLPKKIMFILPGVGISGGVAVVLKHASMLMKAGHDVTIINVGLAGDATWYPGNIAPIVNVNDPRDYIFRSIDILIATGWQTVEWLDHFEAIRKLYFVQSDERRFHDDPSLKMKIGNTYGLKCEYFTEARWIQRMLRDEFGNESAYVPNGLDSLSFYPDAPLEPKSSRRPRVLIEGPIAIPFKGMADAYAAVAPLDCELWIVSSAGKPEPHWRYDRFFEAVQMSDMRKIYSSCDIFLKMSRVEGFFGPPMEAMACGCAVVVGEVTGWDEYIVSEENALVVPQGDVAGARAAIQRLIEDPALRGRLISAGTATAKEWTWERSGHAMLSVVNETAISESEIESLAA
ncbi:glycosyltransferase [Cupriavidus sp. NPDC089707]|uniref:glycosyltransferase n=1 Tax=Cupriavidus sp. NPDC089707 TaxID=3363963 RepID=UPI0038022B35